SAASRAMAAPLMPAPTTIRSKVEAGSTPVSGPDLAAAMHAILVARELRGADRPARMNLTGRDADLGTHAELAAVGELRRGVVDHDRAVELVQESLGSGCVGGDDRIGMRRAE